MLNDLDKKLTKCRLKSYNHHEFSMEAQRDKIHRIRKVLAQEVYKVMKLPTVGFESVEGSVNLDEENITHEEKFLKRRSTFFNSKIDACELSYLHRVQRSISPLGPHNFDTEAVITNSVHF